MALGKRRAPTLAKVLRDLSDRQQRLVATKASNGGTLLVTGALSKMSMADLSDVGLVGNPPSAGQVLAWDEASGKWLPVDGGGGALASLSDVDLDTTPPADMDVLTYDATTQTWVPAAGGAGSLASLSDVDVTTAPPSDGQALTWNASAGLWVPGGNTLAGLEDVDSTTFATGYTLIYSGSNWYAVSRAFSNTPGVSLSSPAAGQLLQYNGTNWVNVTGATPMARTEMSTTTGTKVTFNARRHATGQVEVQLKLSLTGVADGTYSIAALPSWAVPTSEMNFPVGLSNSTSVRGRVDIHPSSGGTNPGRLDITITGSPGTFGTVLVYTP